MLPALVLFRPLWTEPARARCISSLRYPNAFWPECYRVPCFFYAYPGRIFPTIHTNLWNPVASCRPCMLSPSLRIAPAPFPGSGGIGICDLCRAAERPPGIVSYVIWLSGSGMITTLFTFRYRTGSHIVFRM